MKKLLSIVKKLSEKRFAEPYSDWPKLLLGSQAIYKKDTKMKCILPHTPIVGQ